MDSRGRTAGRPLWQGSHTEHSKETEPVSQCHFGQKSSYGAGGIPGKRISAHAHQWTGEEMQTAVGAVLDAVPYPVIAKEMEISEKAIRGMMYRLYKTENQDKIRDIVRKERGMA